MRPTWFLSDLLVGRVKVWKTQSKVKVKVKVQLQQTELVSTHGH